MAKVGDLVVRVTADDKQFKKSIDGSEKKVKKFTKFLLSAAGIAGALLIFRGLTRTVGNLIKAYSVQEQAEAKLAAALRATGGAVGISKDQMIEMSKELQNVTTFGDEAFIAAQGLLTTFTQIGKEVFPDAIEAAADMSTLFGQDLQQSVIQLATDLNDPIAGVGRLKRIGISFTEQQRESIKTFVEQNDVMSAQRVILDELKNEFGGVAREVALTGTGALKQFNNVMGDIKEEGGKKMLEALAPLIIDMTKHLALTLQDWQATANLNRALKGEATSIFEVDKAQAENNERMNEAQNTARILGEELKALQEFFDIGSGNIRNETQ
ncbi:hypothetical protein LCGC14_1981780 [marine sediment metagenome]|uniref:Bacteriophage tail tape measure N-terminal domain-containing protein n=1 Tax=marine sediment metagenome TaxID=412755 RepID=A0A0F9F8V5_9ZZZZ